jgi:beta-galactosidase
VTLDLLVYNMGRISVITNDRSQNRARKGLAGATLDGQDLTDWEMYSLPYASGLENFKASDAPHTGPTFYRSTFNVDKVGSTFLDMSNWGFGAVWVNGHNVGRFLDRGGQRGLFLPSQWLKPGQNEITVLELHDAPATPEITGVKNLVTSAINPWPVDLTRN